MTKHYTSKMVMALVCFFTIMSGSAFAQQLAAQLPAHDAFPEDPWNVSERLSETLLRDNAKPVQAQQAPAKVADDSNAEEFVFLGQSFYAGYSFSYDAGDIINRTAKITIDGDKVIFHKFFNYEAQSSEWNVCEDEDFEGVYDAEAKTITVTTSSDYDEATIVAHTYSGYYDIVMLGGTANAQGQFVADGEIVFDVIGDFEQIKARNHIMLFSFANGYMSGATAGFRSFNLFKPNPLKANIVSMTDVTTFEKAYVGQSVTKEITFFNVGGKDTELNVTISDTDNFTIFPGQKTISGSASASFLLEFIPSAAGTFEATITASSDDCDDITVNVIGNGVEMTDFSPIVKGGDMTITTGLDNPFTLEEVEGVKVAQSGGAGIRRAQSDLFVAIDIPQGKKGTLSWKGLFSSEYPYNIGGVIVDNEIAMQMYGQFTRDFGGTLNDIAPGKHDIDFQYFNDNNIGGFYVYDLELVLDELPADKVTCPREVISLGHHLQSNEDYIQAIIPLYNEGENKLQVLSATCDNEAFEIEVSDFKVSTFETLEVPVTLNTNEVGIYEGTATIETTAGTILIPLKAGIHNPDYSKIVKEGSAPFEFGTHDYMSYQDAAPFIVNEDAEVPYAYNSTAQDIDYDPTYACLEARFSVPEGYTGHLSWEGAISCAEAPDVADWYLYDYPYIGIGLDYNPDWGSYWNNFSFYLAGSHNGDAGSAQYDQLDDEHAYYHDNAFRFGEGEGVVYFVFYQLGDAQYEAEDCMKIWNLNLELISPTGISNTSDTKQVVAREYYTLSGARISKPQGAVIEKVKYSDGSEATKKVIK